MDSKRNEPSLPTLGNTAERLALQPGSTISHHFYDLDLNQDAIWQGSRWVDPFGHALDETEPGEPGNGGEPVVGLGPEFFGQHDLGLTYYIHNGSDPDGWAGAHADIAGFRIWDNWDGTGGRNGCTWGAIHTGPDRFDWTHLDAMMAILRDEGVPASGVIYTLGRTPRWSNRANSDGVPPDDLAVFDAFVTALVTRYAGQIGVYGLWNEPNAQNFWTGTPAQLKTMTARVMPIVKRLDPAALVLSPEFQGNGAGDFGRYWDAAPAGPCHDVIGVHYYGSSGSSQPDMSPNGGALQTISNLAALRTEMQRCAVDQPIWDTEWGFMPDYPGDRDAAAYTAKKLLLTASLGIARVCAYAYDHESINTMWRTDRGLTGLHEVWNTVRGWLIDRRPEPYAVDGAVYTIPIADALAVWHHNGQSNFGIPAGRYRQLCEADGTVKDLAAGATAVPIGNTPVLLS